MFFHVRAVIGSLARQISRRLAREAGSLEPLLAAPGEIGSCGGFCDPATLTRFSRFTQELIQDLHPALRHIGCCRIDLKWFRP